MSTAKKLLTWSDLLDAPDGVKAEIIAGALCMSPSARPVHGRILSKLSGQLSLGFDAESGGDLPGGWWIVAEVDIRLSRYDIVRPDISGWRRSRMPKLPRDVPVELVPDWVCEVLSPSNEAYDRSAKMTLYAHCGIAHAWLVSPDQRLVEAYELVGGRWTVLGVWTDGAAVKVAPFDAIVLDVSGLFPPKDDAVETVL